MRAIPLMLALLCAGPGRTQSADVVRPDGQGDFRTVSVPGARGSYPQRFWLVVDRDPRGLLCRDRSWRAWVALRTGAVLELATADGDEPQPLLHQTKPYVWVQAKPIDLLHDVRFRRDRGTTALCAVRANSSFIAPIHPESLQQVQTRP
ncbi:MAG: hypothetical protein VKO65_04900 [Cyanobacteriota bacterium]|nr:hypothetical protein [Cyanobacteriota bacterium]